MLDYIVMLPWEYFEGVALKEHVNKPCRLDRDYPVCMQMAYPPLTRGVPVSFIRRGRAAVGQPAVTTLM